MSDLFVPAYSSLVIATKSRNRFWDGDAVRTPIQHPNATHTLGTVAATRGDAADPPGKPLENNPAGAPLLDWWDVPAETVAERLTLSMCPAKVCRVCGKPSTRITETSHFWSADGSPKDSPVPYTTGAVRAEQDRGYDGRPVKSTQIGHGNGKFAVVETLGWSDCGHNDWRPGFAFDPFVKDDMTAKYLVADVFDGIATLADDSVDLIVTSPPFLALRSYLPADHEHKSKELGSEATPGAFIDRLLDVVEACARVLAPHGSLVFELGDTYAGSGGAGGDYNEGGLRDGAPGFDGSASRERKRERPCTECEGKGDGPHGRWGLVVSCGRCGGTGTEPPDAKYGAGRDWEHERTHRAKKRNDYAYPGWPLDKSKVLIPQLFAIALAYGFNPLTGRQTEPWRVRNTVAWCRPNPPVGRDGDKFRPATSFLTVACKARDRYWDGDAVRVPFSEATIRSDGYERNSEKFAERQNSDNGRPGVKTNLMTHAGAPLLDYWVIPTAPYKGSHYATYPPDLVVPLVKSMCPARVCRVCGKPSTRIVGAPEYVPSATYRGGVLVADAERVADGANQWRNGDGAQASVVRSTETLGWSDCGHDDYRAGLILDPFGGSGTTAAVATGHGLDCVLIDIDERNAELARERVGMFLDVEVLAYGEST